MILHLLSLISVVTYTFAQLAESSLPATDLQALQSRTGQRFCTPGMVQICLPSGQYYYQCFGVNGYQNQTDPTRDGELTAAPMGSYCYQNGSYVNFKFNYCFSGSGGSVQGGTTGSQVLVSVSSVLSSSTVSVPVGSPTNVPQPVPMPSPSPVGFGSQAIYIQPQIYVQPQQVQEPQAPGAIVIQPQTQSSFGICQQQQLRHCMTDSYYICWSNVIPGDTRPPERMALPDTTYCLQNGRDIEQRFRTGPSPSSVGIQQGPGFSIYQSQIPAPAPAPAMAQIPNPAPSNQNPFIQFASSPQSVQNVNPGVVQISSPPVQGRIFSSQQPNVMIQGGY